MACHGDGGVRILHRQARPRRLPKGIRCAENSGSGAVDLTIDRRDHQVPLARVLRRWLSVPVAMPVIEELRFRRQAGCPHDRLRPVASSVRWASVDGGGEVGTDRRGQVSQGGMREVAGGSGDRFRGK